MEAWLSYLRNLDKRIWYVLLLLFALAFPWIIQSNYWISVAVVFGIWAILGLSLNIIVGYAGLFQLGHAAFWAVGAYTTAILNTRYGIPILVCMPISAVIAAIFAILISRPILHLRGDYLCIVTIGFGEIVRLFLFNDPFGITGGINGIRGIDRPSFFGITINTPLSYYYYVLFFLLITLVAMQRLENSRLGRAWTYVREDETAAETMGIDTVRVKMLAFAIGAAWAGVAGNIYASRYTVIAPETFSFWNSVVMFCIVVLGGTGSIPGIFVGTIGMVVLPELLRELPLLTQAILGLLRAPLGALGGFGAVEQKLMMISKSIADNIPMWRMLIFGAAMVAMMIFRPEGLWPHWRYRLELRREEEAAPASVGTAGH